MNSCIAIRLDLYVFTVFELLFGFCFIQKQQISLKFKLLLDCAIMYNVLVQNKYQCVNYGSVIEESRARFILASLSFNADTLCVRSDSRCVGSRERVDARF